MIICGLKSTWAHVEDGKEGKPEGGRHAQLLRETPLGHPAWEGSVEKW